MGATNEAMLTSGGLVYSKVKTGKSVGQSAWERSLIEELGAEYLTMNVSLPHAGTFHRLTLNSTMVSTRT